MEPKSGQPPLVVVVGETASGKSSLALKLAERFNGEVICADSWTVRREVNIGTAKPTEEERKRIRHHLVDVVGPCEDFSAAVFKRMANEAINEITSRGKTVFMVGGTGLYIDSVIFNYSFLPPPPKRLREELSELSIEQLLARIEKERLSLEGIDTRNKRRLIRLLESGGERPGQETLRPNTLVVGTSLPRDELKQRIAARVDQMIGRGLEQEVQRLFEVYGWECEALKGIGYHEWREYFAGRQSTDQVKQRIIKDTIDLAKRQRTWFRRNKNVHSISNFEEIVDLVTTFLDK